MPVIVHPQFAKRLKKGEKRPLQLEWGINIDALDGTGIPEVVRARQWLHFVQHPNDANDKLVRKFYTSMVPDDFFAWGTVVVQGRQITLTPEIVNEYYGLPNLSQAPSGMERHQFFTIHNQDLAGSLRIDGHRYWSNSNNHDLFHADLDLLIDRFVIRGKSLVPKGPLGSATYNKLANVRPALGLSSHIVRQRVDQP
ncbi:hypothetical protein ACOSP7_020867 [Xanthoceras sorbifolium]